MEAILVAIIGIVFTYLIIYFAVKDAISKKIEKYQIMQVKLLVELSKKNGVDAKDIDRITLSYKDFTKKHTLNHEKNLGDLLK